MASAQPHGSNNPRIPETMSRNSSTTLISPVMRAGVNDIVTGLIEIGGVIRDLSAQHSPDTAHAPNIEELVQDISKLQDEVKGTKLEQDKQIKGIRETVINDAKRDITKSLENEISAIITNSIAAEVEEEMKEWGSKSGVPKLVERLESLVETNDGLLESGGIQLGNSRSRHANSTIEIQTDFNTTLKQVKREDGRVSELFPESLRHLFSYDATKLIRLLGEYNLCPLEKHNENLNRFLIFIGVNISVPDQLADFVEEQLPAYPLGDTAGFQDERTQKSTRRRSSASEKGANASWYGGFFS